jgi:hypothetical protein
VAAALPVCDNVWLIFLPPTHIMLAWHVPDFYKTSCDMTAPIMFCSPPLPTYLFLNIMHEDFLPASCLRAPI